MSYIAGGGAGGGDISGTPVTATGSTTGRILPDRFADIYNVKDFGAKGDGSTNDTTAIQAAFTAAFGNYLTGGKGQGSYAAKKVYFPPGNYKTTSPLYIVGVLGVTIEGTDAIITYAGTGTEGNTLDSTNPTRTPIIMCDGLAYATVRGLNLQGSSSTRIINNFLGFYVFQSGNNGTTTAIDFQDMVISDCGDGILADGVGNCENCILLNVQFNRCAFNGLRLGNANVINWQVYGGGASSCALLSTYNPDTATGGNQGAVYSTGNGCIGVLSGISLSGNQWDIINAGAQQMTVLGGSFEGSTVFSVHPGNATWSGGTATLTLPNASSDPNWGTSGTIPIKVYGVTPSGYNGSFTGTITAYNTITYTVADPGGSSSGGGFVVRTDAGSISANGSTIHISGLSYRSGNSGDRWLDTVFSGQIIATGCNYAPNNSLGGRIATMGNNGILVMDGCQLQPNGATNSGIYGGNNSQVWLRGTLYGGSYTHLWDNFTATGGVREWDLVSYTVVGSLPTAAAKFAGLRGFVTDSNSSTFAATVATGGSTGVPVYCDGGAWKIG